MMAKRDEIKSFAVGEVNRCFNWFETEYEIYLPKPFIIISFSKNRVYSYGGWREKDEKQMQPYVNLSLYECLESEQQFFTEYDFYKDDKYIGECLTTSWKEYTELTVAHEVSHCIEFGQKFSDSNTRKQLIRLFGYSTIDNSHGDAFQKIYKLLRNRNKQR